MSHDWHADIKDEHRQLVLDGHNDDRDTPHWTENPSYPYDERYGIDVTALRDAEWLPSHIVIVDDTTPKLTPPEALRFADSLELATERNRESLSATMVETCENVIEWLRYWAGEENKSITR
jgi:hypothetical protein